MMNEVSKRARVLIVDDEKVIASTLSTILKQHGYETAVSFNGYDAVQLARHFRPELLLSDVCMPGIDGIETARRILSFCPDCKVLLISGAPPGTKPFDNAGPSPVIFPLLPKPAHPREVLRMVALLLEASASQAESLPNPSIRCDGEPSQPPQAASTFGR